MTIFQKLNQKVNDPKMTFDPTSVVVTCDYLMIIVSQVPLNYIKVCGYRDLFFKNLNQRSLTPWWPLTPSLLRSHVWLYPRIFVSKSHENTSKCVVTVTLFWKLEPKIGPYMTFDPTSVEVTCVTLPKDHYIQVPWEYINVLYCGYSDQFCKTSPKISTYCIHELHTTHTEWVIT